MLRIHDKYDELMMLSYQYKTTLYEYSHLVLVKYIEENEVGSHALCMAWFCVRQDP